MFIATKLVITRTYTDSEVCSIWIDTLNIGGAQIIATELPLDVAREIAQHYKLGVETHFPQFRVLIEEVARVTP